MTRKTALAAFVLLPLSLVPSCVRDFDQFDASGEGAASGDGDGGDGDGDLGGSSGDGDVIGDGDGDEIGDGDGDVIGDGDIVGDGDTGTGGSAGGAPNTGCESGQKLCGDDCVSNDDPQTSCNEASCDPCPTVAHADVACSAGACSVGSCEAGFVDCDETVDNGCEHSPSTFDEFACGGCNADCTSLGLTNCQSALCGCAADSECGDDRPDVACNNRVCSCNSVDCNPGETCVRVMGNTMGCRCGGGGACDEGWVCCPGASGASCKQLDGNDSSNCGACGWQCPTGQVCVAGACQ